jgi:hypothetical protein
MDIIDGKEIEKEETVRFCYTLVALKLYKQRTGRQFFSDYEKISKIFTEKLQAANLTNIDNLSVNDQIALLPVLVDKDINEFMLDVAVCFYAEIRDNRYIQNEETMINAESSLWLMDLLNIEFFIELFQEISANKPNDRQKSKKN